MKRVNVYKVIREMRETIVKTMQERGMTEVATILSPEEWAKHTGNVYEPDEDGYDEGYETYMADEAPYIIFFDKYNNGIDYRVDKVRLVTYTIAQPRLEFDCVADEIGDDTFSEDDVVFLTLYNVYDKLMDILGLKDEPEPWEFDEQAFIEEYCPMAGGNDYLGWIDDINKLLDGEAEEGDAASTGDYAKCSEEELRKELKRLTRIVLRQAVDEYVERNY